MSKTKMIATIGPSSKDELVLKQLIKKGIDLIRFNMNYSSKEFCLDVTRKIKKIDSELQSNTGVIIDLKGPSIRIGHLVNGEASLNENTKIRIYMDEVVGDSTNFSISYPNLVNEIKFESLIIINNGEIILKVIDKEYNYLLCKVIKGGRIKENQKITIPDLKINLPFLTEEDIANIKFAKEIKADYLALPFVNTVEDILVVNDALIEVNDDRIEILAKIATEEALSEIDDIINMSDGIIIDRDDLEFNLSTESLLTVQNLIIDKCHKQGKISIIETGKISSQNDKKNDSKSEISDIANAVLAGADAIVLRGEIAYGKYPIETLAMIDKIIFSAEKDIDYLDFLNKAIISETKDITGVFAKSLVSISSDLNCKAIIIHTTSGLTAKRVSRFRPLCPVIAMTSNKNIINKLNLYFGIETILIGELNSFDEIIAKAKKIANENLSLEKGNKIVITGGYPSKIKYTNFIEIEEL